MRSAKKLCIYNGLLVDKLNRPSSEIWMLLIMVLKLEGEAVTPNQICSDIRFLVSKVGAKSELVFLPSKPEAGALLDECFPIVDKKVESAGGRKVLGWQVWKTPLLVEAEFHAVWESPEAGLIDITPNSLPLEKILFLPDETTVYEGKQVNNIRVNITGNLLVDDFIAVCNAIFRIENKGDRAFQYELSLSGGEAQAYRMLTKARELLEIMALQGMDRKSACFC